jgi:hypothetical protein
MTAARPGVEKPIVQHPPQGLHKHIPAAHAEEHMRRWLDYELWLNTLDLPYADAQARTWFTRNFVLRRQ